MSEEYIDYFNGERSRQFKPGMTLLQYYAGLAMQSLIIATQDNIEMTFDKVANEAFEYAEAMVERAKA